MNDIKREKFKKVCKNYEVRARMVAVRMVRVLDISVEETASILVRGPTWVRDWLRRYDEGGLEGLRDLPRCGRPRRIPRNVMDGIIVNVAGYYITPRRVAAVSFSVSVEPNARKLSLRVRSLLGRICLTLTRLTNEGS